MAGAVVGKGADRRSNGVRVCSVADRELNIVFCDEGRGRRLVVDCEAKSASWAAQKGHQAPR